MRYRPMGASAAVVSAISLNLAPDPGRRHPSQWVAFIHAALEQGVSAFEVGAEDPAIIDGLSQALSAVDRRLVFIAWRLSAGGGRRDVSPEGLRRQVEAAIARAGLDYLDAVMLDEPMADALSEDGFAVLKDVQARGAVHLLGLCGEGDLVDGHIGSGRFDILTTDFSLASGWRERGRLRAAGRRGMAVVGRRPWPRGSIADRAIGALLDGVDGWTAQELCVAYALAEAALASVQIEATSVGELRRLASLAERAAPQILAARLERAQLAPVREAELARPA